MKIIASIVSILCISALALAESVQFDPVTDATSYRLSWGVVGGTTTNTANVSTNAITVRDPLTGNNIVKPGVSNVVLLLNARHFIYAQTIQSNATTSVISAPSTIIFYTPRSGPTNGIVIGE